jgi:hypothetical protein
MRTLTFKIRVHSFKNANLGDGLRAFEPGKDYHLPIGFRDHPWIKENAEIVPDSDDDRVFDYTWNRWCTRSEIRERDERAVAHAAREKAEARKRREGRARSSRRQPK